MSNPVQEQLKALAETRAKKLADEQAKGEQIELADRMNIVAKADDLGLLANQYSTIKIPFSGDDIPVVVGVRVPSDAEMKCYRDTAKNSAVDGVPNYSKAGLDLGAMCVFYPAHDAFKRMCGKRPGLDAQVGTKALGLSVGEAEAEGKS